MQNVLGWVVAALAVVVALFIGYFRGYLTQKGQNLATHEDVEKLVDQLRAVTTATKEIEARISNEVWDRQKRWELKRDVLIEMVKKTIALQVALQRLQAVRLANKGTNSPEDPVRLEAIQTSTFTFNVAVAEYDQAKLVVDLVCGLQMKQALLYYEKLVSDTAQAVVKDDMGAYERTLKEILVKEAAIVNAVRTEIGSGPLIIVPKQQSPAG